MDCVNTFMSININNEIDESTATDITDTNNAHSHTPLEHLIRIYFWLNTDARSVLRMFPMSGSHLIYTLAETTFSCSNNKWFDIENFVDIIFTCSFQPFRLICNRKFSRCFANFTHKKLNMVEFEQFEENWLEEL